jgi:predicted nucleic-acid-binding protein
LLGQPAYEFESRAAVEQALAAYAASRAGLSDCLIAAKNALAGCDFTATFDRALRAVPGAKLV